MLRVVANRFEEFSLESEGAMYNRHENVPFKNIVLAQSLPILSIEHCGMLRCGLAAIC